MNNKNIVLISLISVSALVLFGCAQRTLQPQLCDADSIPISSIQGAGQQSPYAQQQITTRGIVTANWQDEDALGGFFIQSLTEDEDNNAATSEGLLIHTGQAPQAVQIDDIVYLTGLVSEQNQVTQLHQIQELAVCGTSQQPEAQALQLPVAATADIEALEGMLVSLTQPLVVNGHYQLARHGQFDVAPKRLYTPTQHSSPGIEARQRAAENQLSRLIIDDNRAPDAVRLDHITPSLNADMPLRSGDIIGPVQGIINEYRGSYRLQPLSGVQIIKHNERPAAPSAPATNTLRVAAFNVLNYFNGEGPEKVFPTERGAKTAQQFERQHNKIISAMELLNADIIGLMEIENDGYTEHSAIAELTADLAAKTGHPWRFVQAGQERFGSDAITNGLIYRSDKVTPAGQPLTITKAPFGEKSRLPLIQRFVPQNTVESLVVAVNHFKSKGSCPRSENDPNANQNDGQACWNLARTQSAQLLADFLAEHNELKRSDLRVLIGDFNAYAQEDPIQHLLEQGYYNRIDSFNPNAYSYVYDAQAGSLDHILVSANLAARVVKQDIWSINADEPLLLQYNQADTYPDWYKPTPYRASDHDPIYADLQF